MPASPLRPRRFLPVLACLSLAFSLLQAGVLETEKLREEAAKTQVGGRQARTWKFQKFPEPMQDWPREVRGAFLEVRCEDLAHSEAVLILLRDDLRRRSYPLKSLVPEDRALAEKLQREADAARKPNPGAIYKFKAGAYDPKKNADVVCFGETDHFTFHWGNKRDASGKAFFTEPNFLERNQKWFERVWGFFDLIGAPMPYADDASPKKINVYITGTGLEKHQEGFAFAASEIIMHPGALAPGSSVVGHEFTHSIQFYSGGYRDSDLVGWFWECHANWSSHQFMPAYPPTLTHYAGRAHYELNSTRHNYGSWPFLETLALDPRFGSGFPYEIWKQAKRDAAGKATEDPFQTIMRLGVEKGVWKDGPAGFGDAIGELAARMAAWDFPNQFYYLKELRNDLRHSGRASLTRTLLEPVADRPGWFRPLFSHTPRQYGVNLVDLIPAPGSRKVEVEFAGIVDENEASDWRATLVAHTATGEARYSATVRTGRLSLELREGEACTLAIAATPTAYVPQKFRPGYNVKRRYPYEVAFQGASPATVPPLSPIGKPAGAKHKNGGGWVATSAKVAPTAYVGPDAMVLDAAEVSGKARIEDQAVVRDRARISDNAVVGGFARVANEAEVSGDAAVRGYARLADKAKLTERARLLEYAQVDGNGTISGDVLVRGFGEVHLIPETLVTGGAVFGEDLEVHFHGSKQPVRSGGLHYGYLNSELMAKDTLDNRHLYARWTFDQPRKNILRDDHADCEGVLRGAPVFETHEGRKVLRLDGSQRALVEGHVVDAENLTFDVQVRWGGGPSGQRLLEFNGTEGTLTLGLADGGRPALLLKRGPDNASLTSSAPLVSGRWTRLTVSLLGGQARIFLDGRNVAESAKFPLSPSDIRPRNGLIGSGFGPKTGFVGQLDEIAVYRTGFSDVSEIPPAPSAK